MVAAVVIQPDAAQLAELLREFRELPPIVKRGVRGALRHTGDEIIEGQRAILDGPLPAGVDVTGHRLTLTKNRKNGQLVVRRLNVYGEKDVQRGGRHTGLRDRIKEGLVTRVVTGTTRQGIEIRTRNSQATMSTGWNARRFRHPVFGNRDRFVYQAGQPYFYAPAIAGRKALIVEATSILNAAIEGS